VELLRLELQQEIEENEEVEVDEPIKKSKSKINKVKIEV